MQPDFNLNRNPSLIEKIRASFANLGSNIQTSLYAVYTAIQPADKTTEPSDNEKSVQDKQDETVCLLRDNLSLFLYFNKESEAFQSFLAEEKERKSFYDEFSIKITNNPQLAADFFNAAGELDSLNTQPMNDFLKKNLEALEFLFANRENSIFTAWEQFENENGIELLEAEIEKNKKEKEEKDVMQFLQQHVRFFAAPFLFRTEFQKWGEKNKEALAPLSDAMKEEFFRHVETKPIEEPYKLKHRLTLFMEAIVGQPPSHTKTIEQKLKGLLKGETTGMRQFLRENREITRMFAKHLHAPVVTKWEEEQTQAFDKALKSSKF